MDLKNFVGVLTIQRGLFYCYFWGHLRSSEGHIIIKGHMNLKLGGCSHHSEKFF